MNANQHKFVFHREGGDVVTIDAHADLPREKFLKRKAAGKIAQRAVVVQLDDEFRIRLGEKILAGNPAGVNGAERDCRRLTCRAHQFRGPANVTLPNEHVQVAIAAHRRVAIGLHRENRSLYHQGLNTLRTEQL